MFVYGSTKSCFMHYSLMYVVFYLLFDFPLLRVRYFRKIPCTKFSYLSQGKVVNRPSRVRILNRLREEETGLLGPI
jgi:hypothetical protein